MGLSDDIEAYAAYINAPRGVFSVEEQELFDVDLIKARAAMERAWLERIEVADEDRMDGGDVESRYGLLSRLRGLRSLLRRGAKPTVRAEPEALDA